MDSQTTHTRFLHRRVLHIELASVGIESTPLGGGRITVHPAPLHKIGSKRTSRRRKIRVFGYSKSYTKANGGTRCVDCNLRACLLVKARYPDDAVSWSNSGYLEKDEAKLKDFVAC